MECRKIKVKHLNQSLLSNRSIDLAERIYSIRINANNNILKKGLISKKHRNCPTCGSIKKDKFNLLGWGCAICKKCKTKYAFQIPNKKGIELYYSEISEINLLLWQRSREKEFNSKLAVLKPYIKKNKLEESIETLELGCGSGEFVDFLMKKNFKSKGIEIDDNLVQKGIKKGYNIMQGDVLNMELPSSDFYLCYEIIEHLIDPKSFLKNVYSKMRRGSYLIITTPNEDGYDNKAVSADTENRFLASALFPPYHINAFSIKSLYFLALQIGFYIVDVSTPGLLDLAIVNHHLKILDDYDFKNKDKLLASWQSSLSISNGSGHMQFILKKD